MLNWLSYKHNPYTVGLVF